MEVRDQVRNQVRDAGFEARFAAQEHSCCIVSCEHGGNRVPPAYAPLFQDCSALLQSHRGYDAGALAMARQLAFAARAPLFAARISRLLIDLNRSVGHPHLYSAVTKAAPPAVREEILARHYLPYRHRVEDCIDECIQHGYRVIHIACHSFVPVLDGKVRDAAIGLLYDPLRPAEAALCRHWQQRLKRIAPQFKVRCNYPYRGSSDGFPCYLRRRFADPAYIGVELEINQKYMAGNRQQWAVLRAGVVEALRDAIGTGAESRAWR